MSKIKLKNYLKNIDEQESTERKKKITEKDIVINI